MKTINTILTLLVLCLLSIKVFAQPGSNDPTFNTIDDGTYGDLTGFDSAVLTSNVLGDGKIIVAGGFSSYNGTPRNYIARLNPDGSLDTTFDTGEGFNNWIWATSIQADGKIIVGGTFVSFNGITKKFLARLNADGSMDDTFDIGTGFSGGSVSATCIQADGKIIVGGNFTSYNGIPINRIIRLNTDGSIDGTFDPGLGFDQMVVTISIQPDGKIIAGGDFSYFNNVSRKKIVRLNEDGSFDTSFAMGTGFNNKVFSTSIQTDGKIIVGGWFVSYNGTTKNKIARLNTDGSLDATFNTGTGFDEGVFCIDVQSDGKIIAGGEFTNFNGTEVLRIARLNEDGSLDATFIIGDGYNNIVYSFDVQSDEKIIVGGGYTSFNGTERNMITRLNENGSLDASFSPVAGSNNSVHSISIQEDGKIIIGGNFTNFNGTLVSRIARLNSDGSLDASFDAGTGFNDIVYATDIQPDGKIMVGGEFTMINGTEREYIARLNANGSLDATFNNGSNFPNTVRTISVESDGQIVIGGDFYEGINLLTATGGNAVFYSGSGFNGSVYTTALQSDNKIIVGGNFSSYDDSSPTWHRIVRLNTSGSLDLTFNLPGTGANDLVRSVSIQSNQKIIVGGDFTVFNDEPVNRIVRLNSNGSIDGSFNSGTGFDGSVYSISIQADGKIIIGGSFTSYNGTPRNGIARLNANGSLDTTFDPGAGFNGSVYATKIQADGKTIGAGEFSQFDGIWRNRIARINNCSPLVNTVTVNNNTLTANATGVSYQWINCNNNSPISGQTNQSFTPTVSGNYAVIVSQNGCEETSDCVAVTIISVDEMAANEIVLFPNPSKGIFQIQSSDRIHNVRVYDSLGKEIDIEYLSGSNQVNCGTVSSGNYIVELILENEIVRKSLIIHE